MTSILVHRDIKPNNILLTYPNNKGEVRAVISDFGISKQPKPGHHSITRTITAGSQGWIAPEIIDSDISANSRYVCQYFFNFASTDLCLHFFFKVFRLKVDFVAS